MKTRTKITIVLATYVAINAIALFAINTILLWKVAIWILVHFGFGVWGHILYRQKDPANRRLSEFIPTLVIGPLTLILFILTNPVTPQQG